METQSQEKIRHACANPEARRRLEPLITQLDLTGWFDQVDNSDFALADWIEALLAFDTWLQEQGVSERPVESMIGYIHCCTLTMAETLAPPNLATLTREMLNRHGFEATGERPDSGAE